MSYEICLHESDLCIQKYSAFSVFKFSKRYARNTVSKSPCGLLSFDFLGELHLITF